MIKISNKHKDEIHKILQNYTQDNFDKSIKEITNILKEYYSIDLKKIGKRLLNKLFSSWLGKTNEAIVHYWILCKLISEYGYPSEYIDIEVPCGNIGRKSLESQISSNSYADIVVYSHESRRPGTALNKTTIAL